MLSTALPITFVASGVAVLVTVGCLVALLPARREPAARPLLGVVVVAAIGAIFHAGVVELEAVRAALSLPARVSTGGGPWLLIALDIPAVIAGLWFLFALEYTGRGRDTARLWATAVIGVLALLVVSTVGLGLVGSALNVRTGLLNIVLGMTIVLATALALLGVFLVVAATLETRAVAAAGTATLVGGIGATLVVPFAATTLRTPVVTPIGLTITALAVAWAVRHHRVLETLPAASVVGRDRVIEELAAAVVLVDMAGRIRGVNESAEELFDIDPSARGRSLAEVAPALPEPAQVVSAGPQDIPVSTGRIVRVTADRVTDDQTRPRGHLLIGRDVTDRRQRENRLGVLTDVFAETVRASLTQIADEADAVASGSKSTTDGGQRIRNRATSMAILTARIRDLEQALADSDPTSHRTVDLTALLADLPTAPTVAAGDSPIRVTVDPPLLSAILAMLTSEPVTGGKTATVEFTSEAGVVSITVSPVGDSDPFGTVGRRIAGVVADHGDWTIDQGPTAVTLGVPSADESPSKPTAGEQP